MKPLSKNIEILRQKAGLSQEQLAMRIGVGKTTVNNIETGYLTAPDLKLLEALANAFATTVDGVLGNKPLIVHERAQLVYVVESLEAAMPMVACEKVVDGIFIDRDKLRGYEHFGLKISDNSMANRRILCGDIVLVRKNAPVRNNDIVVVAVKGTNQTIVRSYHKIKDKIVLKAESDSEIYKDIILDESDNSLKLIGKVIKCEFDL